MPFAEIIEAVNEADGNRERVGRDGRSVFVLGCSVLGARTITYTVSDN